MVLGKSFYIRWSAGRSLRVHEVNPGRDPSRVWLAKGGRKRFKALRIQLIIHSIRHGIDLTSIELGKFSIFQTMS